MVFTTVQINTRPLKTEKYTETTCYLFIHVVKAANYNTLKYFVFFLNYINSVPFDTKDLKLPQILRTKFNYYPIVQ